MFRIWFILLLNKIYFGKRTYAHKNCKHSAKEYKNTFETNAVSNNTGIKSGRIVLCADFLRKKNNAEKRNFSFNSPGVTGKFWLVY